MKKHEKNGSESTSENNTQKGKSVNNNLKIQKMKKQKKEKNYGPFIVGELMDEKKYWLHISTVFNSIEDDHEWKYEEQLSKLPSKEVIQFHLRTLDLANRLHCAAIGTAAEIINNVHCIKYDFDFYVLFRFWIIALGERIYYKVLQDPDYLVNIVKVEKYLFYVNDYLAVIPQEVFRSKIYKEISEFTDFGNVSDKKEKDISEDYKSEKTKQVKCPKLYEAFYQVNRIRNLEKELGQLKFETTNNS